MVFMLNMIYFLLCVQKRKLDLHRKNKTEIQTRHDVMEKIEERVSKFNWKGK